MSLFEHLESWQIISLGFFDEYIIEQKRLNSNCFSKGDKNDSN